VCGGDSAREDGCLRGRDPWDHRTADSTGQIRTPWMLRGPGTTRGTAMHKHIQGRPDPLAARQPRNHPEDSREKQEPKTRLAKKASHKYMAREGEYDPLEHVCTHKYMVCYSVLLTYFLQCTRLGSSSNSR